MAEIAQQVERRVESACAGGSNPSLGTRQSLVSSTGKRAPVYEAGGCTFESCTRYQHGCVAERSIAAACTAVSFGTRWFKSIRTHQHAGLAQLAEQRPPKPKVRGSIPWSGARHLDVAKWSKATACKAEGASPRPFESDRRVQASLAQRKERPASTRRVGRSNRSRGTSSIPR